MFGGVECGDDAEHGVSGRAAGPEGSV
jgi:hypothetical protein